MKLKDCIYKDRCNNKCTPSCIRYIQMNRLLELSNLPTKYQKPITINSVDEDRTSYLELAKIKENITEFIQKGKNLYICSSTCGNAKTSWAVKLALNYFDRVWPNSFDVTRALYIHVPTLLLDIKNFGNIPEYVSRIKEADLVIWDDIAFSKLTEYEHEQLLQFIDNRMANGLSNIYTSNITKSDELASYVGNRLASRIYSNSKVIEFKAGDWRVGGKLE